YLRVGRVSADPVRLFLGDGEPHRRTGSLMVTLVHPLVQAVAVYDQIAAGIAEHFIDGTQMRYGAVCVAVSSYPHVQEGYE
ncbi:phage tail terminator-like protein, partial [Streptococcus suis]|uniref:phage tail terminator-like protein n=1 Tax=Streptococcus suis TaxID=1307 RepID=UPI00370A577B